jgi:hypothetical protein
VAASTYGVPLPQAPPPQTWGVQVRVPFVTHSAKLHAPQTSPPHEMPSVMREQVCELARRLELQASLPQVKSVH